jgi:hypothetical protein
MRYYLRFLLAATAALWVVAADAQAAQVTVYFTGTIVQKSDFSSGLGARAEPGARFSGFYRYDTSTPDTNLLPTVADYYHTGAQSGFGIQVVVDGLTFETDPNQVLFLVELVNNHGNPPSDDYGVLSYNNRVLGGCGLSVGIISLGLHDDTSTALSSVALTPFPPELSAWEQVGGLSIEGSGSGFGNNFFLRGFIDTLSLVPIATNPFEALRAYVNTLRDSSGGAAFGSSAKAQALDAEAAAAARLYDVALAEANANLKAAYNQKLTAAVHDLRTRADGCLRGSSTPSAPDVDDWIVDCQGQLGYVALLDAGAAAVQDLH